MSYSNPMHHDVNARAPIRRAPRDPDALQIAHWLERDGANCQQHLDAAAELRRMSTRIDALRAALQALLALDVKGHQLQDRLQFSDAGQALLAQCHAALDE